MIRHPNRAFGRFALAMLAVASLAGSGCRRPTDRAAAGGDEDLSNMEPQVSFDDRSIKAGSNLEQVNTLSAKNIEGLNWTYGDVVEDALTIRRTDVVTIVDFQHDPANPGAKGPWTFPSLVRNTFQALGYSGSSGDPGDAVWPWVQKVLGSRLADRWDGDHDGHAVDTIPLQLMAVVNRLDLARSGTTGCPPDMYCGAEFRFDYARTTKPPLTEPYFTLILEFVLPELKADELAGIATNWVKLASPDPEKYQDRLKQQLSDLYGRWVKGLRKDMGKNTAADSAVRIRTNSRGGASGPWRFAQYFLTGNGFQQAPLDQQFHPDAGKCLTQASPLGQWLKNNPLSLDQVVNVDYNFFAPGSECGKPVQPAACVEGMAHGSPPNTLSLNTSIANSDDLRHGPALNSCTGCHNLETRDGSHDAGTQDFSTHFDQIKYPDANDPSQLSRFLTGNANGGDPVLGLWTITPPTVPGCGPDPKPRSYNDLLRRYLLHYFLLNPIHIPFPIRWANITVRELAVRQAD